MFLHHHLTRFHRKKLLLSCSFAIDFPVADFPHHNEGQSLSEAIACLRIFCASPKCGGLVLTEVNPDHDVDGAMVPTFTQLLVKVLTDAG